MCAKKLRMKYGVKKNAKKWKWSRIINTDFSRKFTLDPFRNKRNDDIWAEENEPVPLSLINASTHKFEKEILFWGAISSFGLIPARAPINLSKWLHQQQEHSKKNKTIYLTNDLYGKFFIEEVAPAIKKEIVDSLFDERIESKIGDAKLADIWPIENVWRAIKGKLRGQQFDNESEF
ncbi:unnamed protein product [Rotaria sordida]|uniref:Uncharacterized protein n=1 Tax=Rotaria sordida TaxID=392033 RepID=A0A814VM25_9BILA|nr:unnamed protein product [Rotaria sordida]CAF1313192.1 unnamed protein product [Rotaria sordida]CAF3535976.1 unnamed protein product [Rotaria sordida]CAF3695004.1 unnamed protein product [Rotaria sordida]